LLIQIPELPGKGYTWEDMDELNQQIFLLQDHAGGEVARDAGDGLRARIEAARPRSLFVIGSADRFYQPDILEQLERVTGGRSLVIEGANHALEIPGDIPKSLDVLDQMVAAMGEFLMECPDGQRT
jgi:hypothetical protein